MIKFIKKLLGIKNYRPLEPNHIFVGCNVDSDTVGIIVETTDGEEVEVRLSSIQAVGLVAKIDEMLTKL